jgi:hypothetical protein
MSGSLMLWLRVEGDTATARVRCVASSTKVGLVILTL